jgi:hypothetical protein
VNGFLLHPIFYKRYLLCSPFYEDSSLHPKLIKIEKLPIVIIGKNIIMETQTNYKNMLQEYVVKKKLASKIDYRTTREGGADHEPLWISVASVPGYSHAVISDVSKPYTKKVDAEQEAARLLLEHLLSKFKVEKINLSINDEVCIFVDVENKPNFIEDFNALVYSENITISACVSETSPLAHKTYPENVGVYKVRSSRPDAVDTYITYLLGIKSVCNLYKHYYIITGDHFGKTLEDIFNSNNSGSKCNSFTNAQDVINHIRTNLLT